VKFVDQAQFLPFVADKWLTNFLPFDLNNDQTVNYLDLFPTDSVSQVIVEQPMNPAMQSMVTESSMIPEEQSVDVDWTQFLEQLWLVESDLGVTSDDWQLFMIAIYEILYPLEL
jgi:hypothetical protein